MLGSVPLRPSAAPASGRAAPKAHLPRQRPKTGPAIAASRRAKPVSSPFIPRSKAGYQPPFCFCASSLAAAGGGRSGHLLSAIAVVAKDADAREASIEALGDGARHSWRLPGDLLVASSRLMASPILTPSSNRSLWRARGTR